MQHLHILGHCSNYTHHQRSVLHVNDCWTAVCSFIHSFTYGRWVQQVQQQIILDVESVYEGMSRVRNEKSSSELVCILSSMIKYLWSGRISTASLTTTTAAHHHTMTTWSKWTFLILYLHLLPTHHITSHPPIKASKQIKKFNCCWSLEVEETLKWPRKGRSQSSQAPPPQAPLSFGTTTTTMFALETIAVLLPPIPSHRTTMGSRCWSYRSRWMRRQWLRHPPHRAPRAGTVCCCRRHLPHLRHLHCPLPR